MERLHKSCRRLIWLNPLLRFDAFEPRAAGMRAMMPHVDEFRPIHNLSSMGELCAALTGKGTALARAAGVVAGGGVKSRVEGIRSPRMRPERRAFALCKWRNETMLTTDYETLAAAINGVNEGRGVAIATVVETWGSAPRPVGSHLVIDEDGQFLGLCLRRLRRRRRRRGSARRHRRRGRQKCSNSASRMRRRGASASPAAAASKSCRTGRRMKLEHLKALNAARRERRAAVLITRFSDGAQRFVAKEAIAADPLADAARGGAARRPQLRDRARGRDLFPHRRGAGAKTRHDRRRPHLAGSGADRAHRRARSRSSSIRARPSPAPNAFPT